MLSPEYLNLIEFNEVVELYNKLNIDITADIINRIAEMQDIIPSTKYQLAILKQTNGLEIFKEALEETAMLSSHVKKALKLLFEDMAKEDMEGYKELYEYQDKPFKLNESQYKILNQGLKDTNKILKNFTKTIAFQSKQAYVEAIDSAYFKVASGAFDYATAIHTACQELADKGITLKDRLGRNVQLEVAVRRNVMTGIQQTANNINRDIEEYLGCDGYEVTAHMGARPTHAEAQGKQYAISHNSKTSRKYPLWSEVESLWSEYNCRHSYFGIVLGISEPIYTDKELKEFREATVTLNGKKITYYEATQKQRQLENAIRKQKRTVQTLEKANLDNQLEKGQLALLQKKYKDFCKETGLEKDYQGLQVAKRSTNRNKSDIISKNIKEKEKDVQYIGKLDKGKIEKYRNKMITDEVVLTDERLNEHILVYHEKEYEQLKPYIKDIIEEPDIILEDNRNENTIILLKQISQIKKNGRVVIKIAIAEDEKHPKNSIITLMKLNDRTWKQTIKNRGNIIFDKSE